MRREMEANWEKERQQQKRERMQSVVKTTQQKAMMMTQSDTRVAGMENSFQQQVLPQ